MRAVIRKIRFKFQTTNIFPGSILPQSPFLLTILVISQLTLRCITIFRVSPTRASQHVHIDIEKTEKNVVGNGTQLFEIPARTIT
jgi:hypothetical protein